jgi:hypothetical protein
MCYLILDFQSPKLWAKNTFLLINFSVWDSTKDPACAGESACLQVFFLGGKKAAIWASEWKETPLL